MAYTTISAGTIGIADGDQSPTPVDGTVRITPRFPAASTASGIMATGPVVVEVAGGALPRTDIPALTDATALVEFHLHDRNVGPVRLPNTEIPLEPSTTINLRDYLPAGVDPSTGWGIAKGEPGNGITSVSGQNGDILIKWEGGGSALVPMPNAIEGPEGPRGPRGEPGPNTVPTDEAIASAISNSSSLTSDALGSGFIARHGARGNTRRIYVRAAGDDSGDGKTAATAFREIKTALNALADDGPVIRGSVVIDVGPGEYEGGIRMPSTRGTAQDDFVEIIGSVDGNGVPTSIVRKTDGVGIGLLVEDGAAIQLENLKFIGGFSAAVQATRNVYAWFTNIHVDGENVGVRGLSISSHTRYYVKGGLIENLTYAGIDEYFNCSRSYSTVGSSAQQMLIRNCMIGLRAKEGCVGHLDHLRVEDCETGIELIQNSVANLYAAEIKRNGVGLALVNSTSHNEGGVVWGSGADQNAREIYSAGASGELLALDWSGEDMAPTATAGHRPLFVIANQLAEKVVTGEQGVELPAVTFEEKLPRVLFRTAGKHFKVQMFGKFDGATPTSTISIIVRIGSVLLMSMQVKGSDQVMFELDAVADVDLATHKIRGTLTSMAGVEHAIYRNKNPLSGIPTVDATLTVFVRYNAPGQSARVDYAELYG